MILAIMRYTLIGRSDCCDVNLVWVLVVLAVIALLLYIFGRFWK